MISTLILSALPPFGVHRGGYESVIQFDEREQLLCLPMLVAHQGRVATEVFDSPHDQMQNNDTHFPQYTYTTIVFH